MEDRDNQQKRTQPPNWLSDNILLCFTNLIIEDWSVISLFSHIPNVIIIFLELEVEAFSELLWFLFGWEGHPENSGIDENKVGNATSGFFFGIQHRFRVICKRNKRVCQLSRLLLNSFQLTDFNPSFNLSFLNISLLKISFLKISLLNKFIFSRIVWFWQ